MKILLLNTNPVVNKLVTLSSQKTGDTLESHESLTELRLDSEFDLIIVDDSLYSDELMEALGQRIIYHKSLYIHSRESQVPDGFNDSLKKPFLPTDLLDKFINFSKDIKVSNGTQAAKSEDGFTQEVGSDFEELDDLDIVTPYESYNDIVEDLDDLVENNESQSLSNGVLDKDELDEVRSLLDETDIDTSDDMNFDEILDMENENKVLDDSDTTDEFEFDISLDDLSQDEQMEEELDKSTFEDEILDDNIESIEPDEDSFESFELDDENALTGLNDEIDDETLELLSGHDSDELVQDDSIMSLDEPLEEIEPQPNIPRDDELNLDDLDTHIYEPQIESALSELTQDDLTSEVDDDILFDMGSITSEDFKLALGEVEFKPVEEDSLNIEEKPKEPVAQTINTQNQSNIDALKKLLEVLSDESISASLKGTKININITIGE